MENSQIVKVYSLKELKDIAKNYAVCTIEDMNGKRITTWNPIKKPILTHLADCLKKLEIDIYPNGYYNVCFAEAVRFQKDHATKYIICKGTPPREPPQQYQHNNNAMNKNDLLSVTSALGYITQIAELKTENARLTMELKNCQAENAVLEAELEELEREQEGLSEGKGSGTMEFLKDQAPTFMNAIDRYFELQNKRLNLEEKKLEKGINPANPEQKKQTVKRTVKTFEPGSDEHLNYIRLLYKEEKEELMNKEIDKLELLAPEKYQEICTELNLFEDETDDN